MSHLTDNSFPAWLIQSGDRDELQLVAAQLVFHGFAANNGAGTVESAVEIAAVLIIDGGKGVAF